MLTLYDTVGRKTRGSEPVRKSAQNLALHQRAAALCACAKRQRFCRRARGVAPSRPASFPGARKSEGTPPFPGGELERESLPVAGLRHFLLSAAVGWGVPTSVQHADWEVLLLFGAYLPRPRHDVRSQRLQGETVRCAPAGLKPRPLGAGFLCACVAFGLGFRLLGLVLLTTPTSTSRLGKFLLPASRPELVTRPPLGEAGCDEVEERFQPAPTGKLGVCLPTFAHGPRSSVR